MAGRKTNSQGPKFIQYFASVIQALQELGGSARPAEIIDFIASHETIPNEEVEILKSGTSRFNKNVNWARFYLMKAGYVDGSIRGVWSLTERGRNLENLSHQDALTIFQYVQETTRGEPIAQSELNTAIETVDDPTMDLVNSEKLGHREQLKQLLENMSPSGFERLCQRLLRESGFEQVIVTGRTGDGGIDGKGILKVNHFVSFQIHFQCKRYSSSVGPSIIRDFRGAIMGRADKGIILTTGTFTNEARREAIRDGATPIELVDGEKIIDMLEELELGLIKKRTITIFDVDQTFFDEFR